MRGFGRGVPRTRGTVIVPHEARVVLAAIFVLWVAGTWLIAEYHAWRFPDEDLDDDDDA